MEESKQLLKQLSGHFPVRLGTLKVYGDWFGRPMDNIHTAVSGELNDAGGEKRYIYCRFGYSVLTRLVNAGWATIDDAPLQQAFVRVTAAGRRTVADC